MSLSTDSIAYLTSKLPMWQTYKQVQVIPHLPVEDSKRLLEIGKEIDPRYSGTVWCQSCLEDVVKFVFLNFEKTPEYAEATAPEVKEVRKEVLDTGKGKRSRRRSDAGEDGLK